jgi:RNA polymerase sigma factor (sigma-70 family)
MMPMDDTALLQEYARTGAETAFAALVERHIGLVYSAAFRQVRDRQHAEDVTQAVFIVLARKAAQVARHPGLSGWLLQTTRYAANAHIRSNVRRVRREQEAAMQSEMNDPSPDVWGQLAPHLDDALASLGTTDRAVLALRFFENKTAAEIGQSLKLNEEAAKKRANRALEKLRKFFIKRGVALSAGAIAATVSANSVQAAPAGLAKTVAAASAAKGALAVSASTLTLANGALKIMAWAKVKTAIAIGTGILLGAGTATVAISQASRAEKTINQTDTIDAKIERLNRPNATIADALRILGEPARYASGTNYFSKNRLPDSYLLSYTNGVEVWIQHGLIMELRSLRPGPGFGFQGKLRLGSTLAEVLNIVGPPRETISNQPAAKLLGQRLAGEPDVLYTEIGGEPGRCLYWRPDQGVHFLFRNDRVIALILDVPRRSSGLPYRMADDIWQVLNGVDKSKLLVSATLVSSRAGVRPADLHLDIPSATKGPVQVRLGTNGTITDFPHDEALRRENPMVTVNESNDALTFTVWATMPIPEDLSFSYKQLDDLVVATTNAMAKAKKTLIRPGYVGYVNYTKWLFSSPWEYRVRGVIFQFPKGSAGKATVQTLTVTGVKTYSAGADGLVRLRLDPALIRENPTVKVSEKPLNIGPDLSQK